MSRLQLDNGMTTIEIDTPAGPIDALLNLPEGQGPWPGVVVIHDAFGYGADTYQTSIEMAEISLLPAVRRADTAVLIVADGTSCRHQIKDGTERAALHVARVLAMSLDSARSNPRPSPHEKESIHG